MGRHSAPPPAETSDADSGAGSGPDPAPADVPPHTSSSSWRDRLILAATGAVVTAAVILWAGGHWPLALAAGLGAGLVVVVASALAATVPPPRRPPT